MIMITAILCGFFLVHVTVCTIADGSEMHKLNNASNATNTSLSRENDTYQQNIKKECVLIVNETDLIFLQQLVRSKIVHVVELDLQFPSNTSNSMIKEWRWNLTNNVGREILSVLAMKFVDGFLTWTLDVGRKTTKVRVVDEPPGCATSGKEPGDFVAKEILKQLSFADEKEMCFDKVSNKSTQTRCCKIIGKDLLKYQCYVSVDGSEFVKIFESMRSAFYFCLTFGLLWFSVYIMMHFALILQSRTTYITMQGQGYYKLTECPMSLSSILCMLCWDGYGRFISFVRRFLLILLMFLFFWQAPAPFHMLWAIFYPLSRSLDLEELHSFERKFWPHSGSFLATLLYFGYDIRDVYCSARINVLGSISLITLPFNVKRWKKSLVIFYHDFIAPSTMGSSLKDKILLFSKTCISCLCYILFIFISQVMFVLFYTMSSMLLLRQVFIIPRRYISRIFIFAVYVVEFVCTCCAGFIVLFTFVAAPYIVICWVLGLILNVVFFLPYIVYISTLSFYCWMFWSFVEHQYAVLMRLIFDQLVNNKSNSDSNNNNNNMNNGGNNASVGAAEVNQENIEFENISENNGVADIDGYAVTEIVCVVSQELYDKIRERLLPYHGNLFCFVLKVFLISIFSYLPLTLVRILQASDISSTVQALVTLSVGALPYIMNVVAAKKNEEDKDVWKEQLKHRVKPLVYKFTANNPELCRTQLIIRHTAYDSNAQDSRVQESAA